MSQSPWEGSTYGAGWQPTGMHVVVVGDPFEGMAIYGPFKTGVDAVWWAERKHANDVWWAVPLRASGLDDE